MGAYATQDTQMSESGRMRRSMYAPVGIAGFTLVHWVLPSGLSMLTRHRGWIGHRPGRWNLLGLVLVVLGTAFAAWGLALHSIEGWQWTPAQRYLLRRGPYRFTRNPMYVGILALWLGWAVFYGSLSDLIAFLVWTIGFDRIIVPHEERALKARHGGTYVEYTSEVPRWFGRTRPPIRLAEAPQDLGM